MDMVVALAISVHEISLNPPHSDLQKILHSINLKMPIALQGSATFSILGSCAVECSDQDTKTMCNQTSDTALRNMPSEQEEENPAGRCDNVTLKCNETSAAETTSTENCGNYDCMCEKLNCYIEPHREVLVRYGNWIQLQTKFQDIKYKETRWIPDFHHMHQKGHILSICDIHIIIYDPPTYGRHHFHLNSWGYSEQTVPPFKRPNWYNDLYQNLLFPDLEAVLLALNCASAAIYFSGRHFSTTGPGSHFKFISRLVYTLWYMLAASVASISTVTYFGLQFFHGLVSFVSHTFLFIILRILFVHTWNNVHIRSCQLLYWPIFLRGSSFRPQSNIEYAHRLALRKHFMWSNVAVDVILGICFGVAVLVNTEALFLRIIFIAHYITDNLLRSGCVWLMGVPAGFKLNTELAELLGMISLNAIQIFSTLGFFTASMFRHSIRGLAVSGILFGLTVPAALCIDMLRLATLHIQTLHCSMSFLYSLQIQALASLWRLFRGRKWNPLRQRLDSYDYSVEQHVVGSLIFTPLLLLLPTTSVFYMFFTILNTTISLICIVIEITISVLHATPYAEILLWVIRRRFPSGIWLEIMSGQPVSPSTSHGLDSQNTGNAINGELESVVSLLCSNYASIRQIVAPTYKNLLRMNPLSGLPSAYEVLSGQRIPATLQVNLPPTLPWIHVSCWEYWTICFDSVLACVSSP